MPKYLKTCGNELHKEWCREGSFGKLINLRTHRLATILNGFKALKTGGVQQPNICISCLKICRRKREFTRQLESHESLEKVSDVVIVSGF